MREPFEGARCNLNVLLDLEIVIGVAICLLTTYYYIVLNSFLGFKEQKILLGQLLHFYILALIIILIYVANNQLWKRLWELPSVNQHIGMILNLWLCINTFTFLCGLGTLWSLGQCVPEIVTTAETALTIGIDKYYECPEWKLRWDELQFKHQCCGVAGYDDWQNAVWLPLECTACGAQTRAPYSCCRKNCSDCYKQYAPDGKGTMPLLDLGTINTNGCLELFKGYLEKLIALLWGILLVALFLQLCIWGLESFILVNQSQSASEEFGTIKIGKVLEDLEDHQSSETCYCAKCGDV